jgi:hypothetical protein
MPLLPHRLRNSRSCRFIYERVYEKFQSLQTPISAFNTITELEFDVLRTGILHFGVFCRFSRPQENHSPANQLFRNNVIYKKSQTGKVYSHFRRVKSALSMTVIPTVAAVEPILFRPTLVMTLLLTSRDSSSFCSRHCGLEDWLLVVCPRTSLKSRRDISTDINVILNSLGSFHRHRRCVKAVLSTSARCHG